MKKIVSAVTAFSFCFIILLFSLLHIFLPDKKLSNSERRAFASLPSFSAKTFADGMYMQNMEKYLTDQFPLRESFRGINASFELLSGRYDANDIGIYKGHLFALDYSENALDAEKFAVKISKIKDILLSDGKKAYISVIPPKNMYIEAKKYPKKDYYSVVSNLTKNLPEIEYIDIFPHLSLDSYYRTDSHWREEEIKPTAEALLSAMGIDTTNALPREKREIPDFRGVYAGQSAFFVKSESIYYLENDATRSAEVSSRTDNVDAVYMTEKLSDPHSLDKYDIFLGGAAGVINIKNPLYTGDDKRLIVVRDSYGSSIIPLFIEYYSEITAVDMRYISSNHLKEFVNSENADILFLFSVGVIENSEMLRVE